MQQLSNFIYPLLPLNLILSLSTSARGLLLRTVGHSQLPTVDTIFAPSQHALLVEVLAGDSQNLSSAVQLVASVRGEGKVQGQGVSLDAVVAALEQHGISVQSKRVDARSMSAESLERWLEQQAQHPDQGKLPLMLLYHRDTTQDRNLASSSSADTPPTLFEISQYQIVLWTAIGLVVITLSAVMALGGMNVEPDSILYAKFISGRTKTD
jgi:hypothetical protein